MIHDGGAGDQDIPLDDATVMIAGLMRLVPDLTREWEVGGSQPLCPLEVRVPVEPAHWMALARSEGRHRDGSHFQPPNRGGGKSTKRFAKPQRVPWS
jgi:hypothetical protein